MTAREEVLARIRTALRDRPRPAPVVRDYRTAATPDGRRPAELAALLADRLADYGARVHRVDDSDVPSAVAAALAMRAG
ncbi:MAG: lactate utilization protein C, partial [Actinomycetota bacterium]